MQVLLGLLFLCVGSAYSACERDMEVVCYWGSWSIYRDDIGFYNSEHIDPSLCTNIVYTFVGLDVNSEIASLDSWADVNLGGFTNITGMKENYTCLRTTLAIGGWNEGSIKYSVMAASEETRRAFAKKVLSFLVYYGFDGLDLDWEYPTARGGLPEDGQNFAALVKVIKEVISPWGLILTTAVPIDHGLIGTAYDVPAIAESVDYVHLMAYDYISSTSNVTGLSAPLSAIKETVSNWLNAGLPSNKLILGIPTYARNFVLENENQHDVGAPVVGVGLPGDFTTEAGFLAYYEVLDIINDEYLDMQQVQIDNTNYAYGDLEWITFETEATVRTKTQYAIEENLGGVMLWSLETDDFRGLYGKNYPLLSTVNNVMNEYRASGKIGK